MIRMELPMVSSPARQAMTVAETFRRGGVATVETALVGEFGRIRVSGP